MHSHWHRSREMAQPSISNEVQSKQLIVRNHFCAFIVRNRFHRKTSRDAFNGSHNTTFNIHSLCFRFVFYLIQNRIPNINHAHNASSVSITDWIVPSIAFGEKSMRAFRNYLVFFYSIWDDDGIRHKHFSLVLFLCLLLHKSHHSCRRRHSNTKLFLFWNANIDSRIGYYSKLHDSLFICISAAECENRMRQMSDLQMSL